MDKKVPGQLYRILFLEDNPDDVELMQHELDEAKFLYVSKTASNRKDFMELAHTFHPDVILADYSLASFNGTQAFNMIKEEGLNSPFILVTGALSEDLALECLKIGIDDFVLKSSFKRLPNAIVSAVEKKEAEAAKDKMAAELEKSREELRQLVQRHHLSLEDERLRISRDLHDELGQVLTALKIDITMLQKKIRKRKAPDSDIVDQEFMAIIGLVDKITQSVKEISVGLRPETLDALGIIESIRWQAIEFENRSKIVCKTFLTNDLPHLNKVLSITVFRVVQESLTNVARHAEASEVEIYLSKIGQSLLLEIKDNGRGIREKEISGSKSLGLLGLRERVHALSGTFVVAADPQGGTRVTVLLPIENDNDKNRIS